MTNLLQVVNLRPILLIVLVARADGRIQSIGIETAATTPVFARNDDGAGRPNAGRNNLPSGSPIRRRQMVTAIGICGHPRIRAGRESQRQWKKHEKKFHDRPATRGDATLDLSSAPGNTGSSMFATAPCCRT